MTKTCGKCKWFGSLRGTPGGVWQDWCRAPVPMVAMDAGKVETHRNNNAKDCQSYKKRKENHGTS